jgi:hypothetical protein
MYRHTPLPEELSIRILYLQPASKRKEVIRCELKAVPLDTPPSYEALSYAWDSENRDVEIRCHDSTLKITPNCAAALRRLRKRDVSRALWIDAICIDQSSVEERNQQVQHMDKVYRKAELVICWLGEGTPATDRAFTQLHSYAKIVEAPLLAANAKVRITKLMLNKGKVKFYGKSRNASYITQRLAEHQSLH